MFPTIRDPRAPSRQIKLSDADEQAAYTARKALSEFGLTIDQVFKVFRDWQSRQTVTAKRLLASSAMIFAAMTWIEMDLSEISFFGLEVSSTGAAKFSIFASAFIIVSGIMFEWCRRIDLAVRRANIEILRKNLQAGEKMVAELDALVARCKISSVDELFDDFRERLTVDISDIQSYDAIRFYKTYLKRAGTGLRIVESAELLIVYPVAAYAVYGLSTFWR